MPEENKIEDIFAGVEETPTTASAEADQSLIQAKKAVPGPKKKINFSKIIRSIVIIIIAAGLGLGIWYALPKIKSVFQKQGVEAPVIESEGASPTTTPAIVPEPEPEILDTDKDGLSDIEERDLGTNEDKPDSDQDGLADKEEVKIYLTDPLNPDTDGDGILDGNEIKQGQDPKDPNPEAKLLDLQKEIEKLR